jgi:hypothetical protein
MIKQLKELVSTIYDKSLTEQYEILNSSIENWMADAKAMQIDDITILGIRV